MGPPYVFRALVFGLIAAAVVTGASYLASDVFRWAWAQDPTHVRFAWPPPHFRDQQAVLALTALGALGGMYFDKTAPLRWPIVLVAATLFGLLTIVALPICSFIWDWSTAVITVRFCGATT